MVVRRDQVPNSSGVNCRVIRIVKNKPEITDKIPTTKAINPEYVTLTLLNFPLSKLVFYIKYHIVIHCLFTYQNN